MLKQFQVTNFGCIQTIECFHGFWGNSGIAYNEKGKTSLFNAISILKNIVLGKDNIFQQYYKPKFIQNHTDDKTTFNVVFEKNGLTYDYTLELDFSDVKDGVLSSFAHPKISYEHLCVADEIIYLKDGDDAIRLHKNLQTDSIIAICGYYNSKLHTYLEMFSAYWFNIPMYEHLKTAFDFFENDLETIDLFTYEIPDVWELDKDFILNFINKIGDEEIIDFQIYGSQKILTKKNGIQIELKYERKSIQDLIKLAYLYSVYSNKSIVIDNFDIHLNETQRNNVLNELCENKKNKLFLMSVF